jgi:high frequency lysogenization protein
MFVWVVELLMNISDQKFYNMTLALAGIFQAATLVRDLAKTGVADDVAFQTAINSLYKIDAKDVPEVYGGARGLRVGLQEIIRLLGNDKAATDPYIGRYVISLLHLERKLVRNKAMLDALRRRIEFAVSQANYFSPTHPTVLASLADIYLNTLGTLPFRIPVLGQVKFLQQADIINKVRALFLAGVRSTVLWRQLGGTRWQLFLQRNKLIQMAQKVLKES